MSVASEGNGRWGGAAWAFGAKVGEGRGERDKILCCRSWEAMTRFIFVNVLKASFEATAVILKA